MDTIEKKVHQLKELSKKQKKLNEFKQDIADILGTADMAEKEKIAEKMSKIEYENINQARNLQFIVPHVVKEHYEHEGNKGEFIAPKKIPPVAKPIAEETVPTFVVSEPEKLPKNEEKIIKNNTPVKIIKKEVQKPKQKTGFKMHFIPGFETQTPVIETENLSGNIKNQKIEKTKKIKPAIKTITQPIIKKEKTEVIKPTPKIKKTAEIKIDKEKIKPTKKEEIQKKPSKLKTFLEGLKQPKKDNKEQKKDTLQEVMDEINSISNELKEQKKQNKIIEAQLQKNMEEKNRIQSQLGDNPDTKAE